MENVIIIDKDVLMKGLFQIGLKYYHRLQNVVFKLIRKCYFNLYYEYIYKNLEHYSSTDNFSPIQMPCFETCK